MSTALVQVRSLPDRVAAFTARVHTVECDSGFQRARVTARVDGLWPDVTWYVGPEDAPAIGMEVQVVVRWPAREGKEAERE